MAEKVYKMTFGEFKIAAQRHFESCGHIMNHFNYSQKSTKDIRLLWNIYYLSGYVIECSVKYAFFKIIRFDAAADIKTLNYDFGGKIYNYDRYVKNHKVDILKTGLETVGAADLRNDIPYITASISVNYKLLVSKWDSDIRYSTGFALLGFALDKDLIKDYLDDVVKPIYEKLTQL